MRKPWHLDRRTFLRGTGISLALPLLNVMPPKLAVAAAATKPVRMICIGTHLGFYTPYFFPKQAGANYDLPPLLKPLALLKDDFTVFSGLDHAGVGKGHPATVNFLTGCEKPRDRKQMSVDQVAANFVGSQTRFASVQLEAHSNDQKGKDLSFGPGGVPLPTVTDPRQLFERLFAQAENPKEQRQKLADAKSVLDHVLEDVHTLEQKLGKEDREKLDEYLASIRAVEQDLQKAKEYLDNPRAALAEKFEIPNKARLSTSEASRLMYKLTALMFQADLSRVVTYRIPGENHAVSHHGQKQGKLNTFVDIQRGYMEDIATLLQLLKSTKDQQGDSLLDNTMVLVGSGMGNASIHSTRNLPILLAGGGFKHRGHIKNGGGGNPPLCNLYVTMLQRMGIETDKFSQSRGDMNHLLT